MGIQPKKHVMGFDAKARHLCWILVGTIVGCVWAYFVLHPVTEHFLLYLLAKENLAETKAGGILLEFAVLAHLVSFLGWIGGFGLLFHFLRRGAVAPQAERRRRASRTTATILGVTFVGLGLVVVFRYPLWRRIPSQGIALILSCDPFLLGNTQSQVEGKLGKPLIVSRPGLEPPLYHVWHYPYGTGWVAVDVAFDKQGNVSSVSREYFD